MPGISEMVESRNHGTERFFCKTVSPFDGALVKELQRWYWSNTRSACKSNRSILADTYLLIQACPYNKEYCPCNPHRTCILKNGVGGELSYWSVEKGILSGFQIMLLWRLVLNNFRQRRPRRGKDLCMMLCSGSLGIIFQWSETQRYRTRNCVRNRKNYTSLEDATTNVQDDEKLDTSWWRRFLRVCQ